MKLRYLLPLLYFFNAQAQTKLESNLHSLDFKNKYVDVAARDTFGLKEFVNIKGVIKLKYDDNSVYLSRNGLLNHSYGANLDLQYLKSYYNNSRQNIRSENFTSQNSPIGQINTKTTLLNENRINDLGIKLDYDNYFISYESARKKNKVAGETLIEINGDKDLITYIFNLDNKSSVYGLGFKHGLVKFIENNQDGNKFNNYFIKANYENLNLYRAKEIAALFNLNLIDDINLNLIYNKRFSFNLSTGDYSELNKKDLERELEDELRLVPRVSDARLEILRNYTKDMFFTDLFSFYLDKDNFEVSINLNHLLAHYSKDSEKIGLKYDFVLLTYDTKRKEIAIGLYLKK